MCWHKKLKRICPLVVVASAVLPQLATTSDVSERRDRVRPNKESQSAVCLKRKNSALSEGSIVGNAIVAKELPNLGALLFHSQSGEDEEIVRALGDSEEILDCAPNSAMQRVLGGSFKKFDASNYSTAAHAANRRLQYWRPTPIIDSARATVWNTAPAVPGVHPVTQAQHAPLGTRPLMGAPILNPYSTAPGPLLRPNGQHPPGSILRPVTGTAGGQVQQVHHPGAPPVGRIPVLVAPVAAPAMSQVTNVAAPAVATTAARATGSVVNSATYSAAVAANRATYTNNVMYSGANRANNMLDKYNQLKQQDPNNEFVGIVESMNTIFKGNATANSPPPQPAGRPADTADSVSSLASGIGSSMMQFDEFKERALKNVTQTSSGITGRAHDPRNHKEVLDAETVKDLRQRGLSISSASA